MNMKRPVWNRQPCLFMVMCPVVQAARLSLRTRKRAARTTGRAQGCLFDPAGRYQNGQSGGGNGGETTRNSSSYCGKLMGRRQPFPWRVLIVRARAPVRQRGSPRARGPEPGSVRPETPFAIGDAKRLRWVGARQIPRRRLGFGIVASPFAVTRNYRMPFSTSSGIVSAGVGDGYRSEWLPQYLMAAALLANLFQLPLGDVLTAVQGGWVLELLFAVGFLALRAELFQVMQR